MVTRFKLIDQRTGKAIAQGEIDGDTYRVIEGQLCTDFESAEKLLQVYEGCAIQSEMFESSSEVCQMQLTF